MLFGVSGLLLLLLTVCTDLKLRRLAPMRNMLPPACIRHAARHIIYSQSSINDAGVNVMIII